MNDKELPLMPEDKNNILLFHPNIPPNAGAEISKILQTRWIGQGAKVDKFEKEFSKKFCSDLPCVAVNSGTSALHLAYILSDINKGDEVICPVFTCTATNIPLLYLKAKIVFADIDPETMNISVEDVARKITDKTKAIVCVHYGGLPCDMDELRAFGIPIIQDSAHALGAKYRGDELTKLSEFSIYSFQAIKHITTADGGMLIVNSFECQCDYKKAKRIRWFGIDREAKQKGVWENDITEIGYKYQMTDLAATLGLEGLKTFDEILTWRKILLQHYWFLLRNTPGIKCIGTGAKDVDHAAWLCTIFAERRDDLIMKLRENGIESGKIHYRNDRYKIFEQFKGDFPNMDKVDDKYMVLPLHPKITIGDVSRVCQVINSGW